MTTIGSELISLYKKAEQPDQMDSHSARIINIQRVKIRHPELVAAMINSSQETDESLMSRAALSENRQATSLLIIPQSELSTLYANGASSKKPITGYGKFTANVGTIQRYLQKIEIPDDSENN